MTNLAHPSSTGSASKAAKPILPTVAIFFISGVHPLGVDRRTPTPQQHFSTSSDCVLFNNKSFQTNLHFWISFICIYFFFSQKFSPPPFAHPLSFQNFKMKNNHPGGSPPITLLLVCQSEKTQKTRLFGINNWTIYHWCMPRL